MTWRTPTMRSPSCLPHARALAAARGLRFPLWRKRINDARFLASTKFGELTLTDVNMSYANPPSYPQRTSGGSSGMRTLVALLPLFILVLALPLVVGMWVFTRY